jgi:NADH dehydrogenase
MSLFKAAREAEVGRVVHVSITNPSMDSPLEYFQGKALLEKALERSGLAYSILRPALLFGEEGILINNIAWALRRLPLFGVFGAGDYELQPIFVGDFADLVVAEGAAEGNRTIDAIGPDTFTYRGMVSMLGEAIGCKRPIISVPPRLGYVIARVLGWLLGDVLLTWDEIQGLMDGLLSTDSPPVGRTSLRAWAAAHAEQLGTGYASELARRRDRKTAYTDL